MDPHSRAAKKIKSHGNEVLPQDTTHLIQRPCYQRGSLCQDSAGKWLHKDLLTIVKRCKLKSYQHVSCSSDLAKTILQGIVKGGRQRRKKEVGRQNEGMDRPGVCKIPDGNGNQRKMEETGCEITCGAPTTPTVKG